MESLVFLFLHGLRPLLVLFSFFMLWLGHRFFRYRSRLPPGPVGSLISGSLGLLPRTQPWKVYADWSKRYTSDIISFRVYNRTTIVLNTLESATTLLSTRSSIYSDRPQSWMYNEICGRGMSVFNISASNPRHRAYRRMLQAGLGKPATQRAQDTINAEAAIFINGLATSPDLWQTHIRRNAAGVIMRVAFGYKIDSIDDHFVRIAEETTKITSQALSPGRWFVDYFPLLRFVPSFLPGADWKRKGMVWRERLSHLSDVPHQWVKQQMKRGNFQNSLTSDLLQANIASISEKYKPEEHEDLVKWCSSALYAGAADTTVSAITSFMLIMALYPEVQKKAQIEVDEKLGGSIDEDNISVDFEKLHHLEYLNAVSKEILRFAPVGNIALAHCASQDDEYLGYHIPKGTTIVPNVWAILHDTSIYPEPNRFDPARFLSVDGHAGQMDPSIVAFGFGRRVCPGNHFATTTILIAMACVLAEFDVTCENPKLMRESIDFTTGITSHVKPFPISIRRRIKSI